MPRTCCDIAIDAIAFTLGLDAAFDTICVLRLRHVDCAAIESVRVGVARGDLVMVKSVRRTGSSSVRGSIAMEDCSSGSIRQPDTVLVDMTGDEMRGDANCASMIKAERDR